MKTIITTLFSSVFATAFGQFFYSGALDAKPALLNYEILFLSGYSGVPWYVQKQLDPKKVDTLTILTYKNNKLEGSSRVIFNPNGTTNSNSNGYSVTQFEYRDTLRTAVSYKTKKHSKRSEYSYENGNIVRVNTFNDGKLSSLESYNYKNGKCVETVSEYYSKKKSRVFRMFDVYDDLTGAKTASKYYVDGKLERVYNYTCDDNKGAVINEKDLASISNVCTYKEERNDGSYTEFKRTINGKETWLTQKDFNADSVLIRRQSFSNDTILRSLFDASNPLREISKSFSKKGKFINHHEAVKRENGDFDKSFTYNKKGKIVRTFSYVYDEKGTVTGTRSENSKGKVYETKIIYSYR